MTPTNRLVPALVITFVAWRVYMRVRRNIGRQPLRPTRLKVSIAIFGTIIVAFGAFAAFRPLMLAALVGGLAVSAGLAWWGLHLTKFEDTPQGKFYTPNTALGLAVSVLFIGRVLYRFLMLSNAGYATTGAPPAFSSPLTYCLFGISAGYYVAYYAGVLVRSRRAPPSDPT